MIRLPTPFEEVPVVVGTVPEGASLGLTRLTDRLWAADGVVVFDARILRVLIEGTDQVTVEVTDPSAEELAWAPATLGYGFVASVLHLHAGRFCLHASMVRLDGSVVLVAGHRGAGKSTTVTRLRQRCGAGLLVDDVVPVELVDGRAIAYPFRRPVHLRPDALEWAGLDANGASTVGSGDGIKFSVDLAEASGPVSVDHMVVLTRAGAALEPLSIHVPDGADRLRLVVRMSNSTGLASLGARTPAFFGWSTGVAAAVQMTEIRRDPAHDTLDQIVSAISQQVGRNAGRELPLER